MAIRLIESYISRLLFITNVPGLVMKKMLCMCECFCACNHTAKTFLTYTCSNQIKKQRKNIFKPEDYNSLNDKCKGNLPSLDEMLFLKVRSK